MTTKVSRSDVVETGEKEEGKEAQKPMKMQPIAPMSCFFPGSKGEFTMIGFGSTKCQTKAYRFFNHIQKLHKKFLK